MGCLLKPTTTTKILLRLIIVTCFAHLALSTFIALFNICPMRKNKTGKVFRHNLDAKYGKVPCINHFHDPLIHVNFSDMVVGRGFPYPPTHLNMTLAVLSGDRRG